MTVAAATNLQSTIVSTIQLW